MRTVELPTGQAVADRRQPPQRRGARPRAPLPQRLVTGALWTVVVAFGMAYALTLAVPAWFSLHDQRLLIVTSGSMSGTRAHAFSAGDAVLLQQVTDPSQLKIGQVVTFWPPGSERLVTHRVVALHMLPVLEQDTATGRMVPTLDPATGQPIQRPYVITQGDANPAPDPDAVPLTRVQGVVLDVRPGWGWVLQWSQSAQGRLVLLGPPLAALGVLELLALLRERRARPTRHAGEGTAESATPLLVRTDELPVDVLS